MDASDPRLIPADELLTLTVRARAADSPRDLRYLHHIEALTEERDRLLVGIEDAEWTLRNGQHLGAAAFMREMLTVRGRKPRQFYPKGGSHD